MTDGNGLPVRLTLTPDQTHDAKAAYDLIHDMCEGQMLLADRAYDANWIRNLLSERGAWANIPPKRNRKVERFFNKLKYFRRIATRYDRCAKTFLSAVALAATVIFWL